MRRYTRSFQGPEVWDEEHDDGEDGYRQNRADLDEVEEAVAAGRVDEDAGRLKRRQERTGGGVGDGDGEGARVEAERECGLDRDGEDDERGRLARHRLRERHRQGEEAREDGDAAVGLEVVDNHVGEV